MPLLPPPAPPQSCPAPDPNEPLFADWLLDYCLNIAVARGDLDLSRRLVAAGASATQVGGACGRAAAWDQADKRWGMPSAGLFR